MKPAAGFLTRHRRLLLIALLSVTLLVSSTANRRRLEQEAVVTSLPVVHTQSSAVTAVNAYIDERDAAHQRDVAALTALIAQEELDAQTRQAAADQLQALVHSRESQQALEAALASTSLAPCAAVVTGTNVTIVTAKTEITPEDSALVITLAAAHAGAAPGDVRILTAE